MHWSELTLVNEKTNILKIHRYIGFDWAGEVFSFDNNKIFRGIYKGYGSTYKKVLTICEDNDLFRQGIIKTKEIKDNRYDFLGYDLILEHEKIPFITYPFEWSATMLKEAAIFHTSLFKILNNKGLTIKDWHPYNILFKNTKPVFVDFASIIPVENLKNEKYLNLEKSRTRFWSSYNFSSKFIHEMFCVMFKPYFLFPLLMMNVGNHAKARSRLKETILNSNKDKIKEAEVLSLYSKVEKISYDIQKKLCLITLLDPRNSKKLFFGLIRSDLERLRVSPKLSGYTNYYTKKRRNLDHSNIKNWDEKQRTVRNIILNDKPKSVLDIGCNTGWFSILAAKLGCQVVATDVDEACVDILYQNAARENLAILPLVIDIMNLTDDKFPLNFSNQPSLSSFQGEYPIVKSTKSRLKCEMVLFLALIHHLCLGKGLFFSQIIQLLNSLTDKYLVIEYVSIEDELIRVNPTFFPEYSKSPEKFNWYSLDNLVNELKKNFVRLDIKDSESKYRKIIICYK